MSKKTCGNCVSRYICFMAGAKSCGGWNDEEVFRGLLKVICAPLPSEVVDEKLEMVKRFNTEARESF